MIALWTCLLSAYADNFDSFTRTLSPTQHQSISIHGYQRIRASALYNLDLDHGVLPSGDTLYPVPLDEGQWLNTTDMRLRADVSAYSPRGLLNVFVRVDFLDNVRLGSSILNTPINTTSQDTSLSSVYVRRAYSTILTPVGFVVAGRMGAHWGLGMLTNDGDCIDCDSKDASDRLAFITSLGGHLWSVAYDFSSAGVGIERGFNRPELDATPFDNVHNTTFAIMNVYSDGGRKRRRRAKRFSVEYGALGSFRWQQLDTPAFYTQNESSITPSDLMFRGYSAQVYDGWFRCTGPTMRIEAEMAYLHADIAQPSLAPDILIDGTLQSDQWGFALESDFGSDDSRWHYGLHAGAASGDSAPGFGAQVDLDAQYGAGGDLEGAQFRIGEDMQIDNFRFHPDYRIDKILFRELIGTITDTVYLKPHVRYTIATAKTGDFIAHQSLIYSRAVEANSTPGGANDLGMESNTSLEYTSSDGFGFQIDYAILFPLAGLHNSRQNTLSTPAQLMRAHLRYQF